MRPVPIPQWVRDAPWAQGTAVFGAPDGDLTSVQIPAAEGVFYDATVDGFGAARFPMVGVVLELDESDLAALRGGARHLLLSWHGRRMPVFTVPVVIQEGED